MKCTGIPLYMSNVLNRSSVTVRKPSGSLSGLFFAVLNVFSEKMLTCRLLEADDGSEETAFMKMNKFT